MRKHKVFKGHTQSATSQSGKNSGPSREWVLAPLPFDYELRESSVESPRELILLLHGFAESGARILRKLEPALPKEALIIAPNATFPMAHRNEDKGYVLTYSWYFYDPQSQEYIVDMRVALEHVRRGIAALGYSSLPKRIIGFSQGGYLAPFIAKELGNVTQVIGIACEFLHEELGGQFGWRLDHVHGAEDNTVEAKGASSSYDEFRKKFGLNGEQRLLATSGHKIDANIADAIGDLLRG